MSLSRANTQQEDVKGHFPCILSSLDLFSPILPLQVRNSVELEVVIIEAGSG